MRTSVARALRTSPAIAAAIAALALSGPAWAMAPSPADEPHTGRVPGAAAYVAVPAPSSSGDFAWGAAAIGAGVGVGAGIALAAGASATRQRRRVGTAG